MELYEFEFIECLTLAGVKNTCQYYVNVIGYTLVSVVPFFVKTVEVVDGDVVAEDVKTYLVTLQRCL